MRPYDLTRVWSTLSGRVYFWPALIGAFAALGTAQIQKSASKTQSRIAELQLMTEQKAIDAQAAAAKAERDVRVAEINAYSSTPSVAASPTTADASKFLPWIAGGFILILVFFGLRRI